jgi:Rps23 Pro-64 3,4-dihydroxylase Tpa1-like proline 4-hydroxylase
METIQLPIPYNTRLCFRVRNVFTPQECALWIRLAETKGFEPALVGQDQQLDLDYRKSDRCLIFSDILAEEVFGRIKHLLPQTRGRKQRKIAGLNERMSFLRYFPGDYFRSHMDGSYKGKHGSSYYTVMVYLNEGFEGGATRFLSSWESPDPTIDLVPEIGMVVVFDHNVLHEGLEVTAGVKYAVRTDVMYTY